DLSGDERHGALERGGRIEHRRHRGKSDPERARLGRRGRRQRGDEGRDEEPPDDGTRHAAVIRRIPSGRDARSRCGSKERPRDVDASSRRRRDASATSGEVPREGFWGMELLLWARCSTGERDRSMPRVPIGKRRVNSMALGDRLKPIRLTCLETASYTEATFGFSARARSHSRSAACPWFTEKGTGGHEGVRKEGQS